MARTLDDIPLFATLKSRLGYLGDRQQMIAQNVANADTPGFTPSGGCSPARRAGHREQPADSTLTSPMHLAGTPASRLKSKPVLSPDSETTLDGNSVVLEEEMMRMSQSRMDYDTAVSFYQQAMTMLQTAAKRPGT